MLRFFVAVEENYSNNPYHNRVHAADVLRTLHVIMHHGGVRQALHKAQDIALLATYLAAVIHDYEHKGGGSCALHLFSRPVSCECILCFRGSSKECVLSLLACMHATQV